MKISIFSEKGGAGKSSVAVSLYDYFKDVKVVSNDFAGKFDNYLFYEKVEDIHNVEHNGTLIYDFGGFAAAEVIDIIKQCNVVLIPTLNDDPSYLQEMIDAAEQLEKANRNIIFVINAADTSTLPQAVIEDHFQDKHPYISIRMSKGFKNGLWIGKTVTQLQKAGGRDGFAYRNVVKDLEQLAELIKIIGE